MKNLSKSLYLTILFLFPVFLFAGDENKDKAIFRYKDFKGQYGGYGSGENSEQSISSIAQYHIDSRGNITYHLYSETASYDGETISYQYPSADAKQPTGKLILNDKKYGTGTIVLYNYPKSDITTETTFFAILGEDGKVSKIIQNIVSQSNATDFVPRLLNMERQVP